MKTRVMLARCADYSPGAVSAAVDRLLVGLGGAASLFPRGSSVLLKPNLLTDREPEKAVTTHPEVARAVIRIVKTCGGRPAVADSPANVTKVEKVWERTGFRAMCEQEGVPLVNLEEAGSVTFDMDGIKYSVAKPVLDADVVVNLPKVKTHMLTVFTGAVKNLYGTLPGFQKTNLHKLCPTPPEFSKLLAALHARVKPQLTVVDGVIGMDGEGPSGGRPVQLGFLAASTDCVAVDVVMCRMLGISLKAVGYIEECRRLGSGEGDWSNIEVQGEDPGQLAPRGFRVPSTIVGKLIPGWLVKWLGQYVWIRPAFRENCVACGRCIKACPVNALAMDKSIRRPVLDAAKCLQCCCCHEVCPEGAVEMKQSRLLSFVRGGRLP